MHTVNPSTPIPLSR